MSGGVREKMQFSQKDDGTFKKKRAETTSWRVSASLLWVRMSWKTSSNVISHPCEVKLRVAGPKETNSHQTNTM